MATGNGSTKWVVGIAVSVVMAIAGWGVTAVLADRVRSLSRVEIDVDGLKNYAVSNDKRITKLEAQYDAIMSGITEIKTTLKEHAAR